MEIASAANGGSMIFIDFSCPSCGSRQRAGDHLVGRLLRCSACAGNLIIPPESTEPPLPAPVSIRQEQASHAEPAVEPDTADPDDLFFQHIRKSGRRTSKHW